MDTKDTIDAMDTKDTQETKEIKDYVVLLETRDKMEHKIQAYNKWMDSAIEYLKTQGHVIHKTYAMKPMVLRSRTFVLFGKGVYLIGDGDDYFDDETEIIVLNMTGGNWSIVTDKRKLANRRRNILSRHVRIKGRPLNVALCGECDHVVPRIPGPCTENCPCCSSHEPNAPTPLEDD
ncbi:hypothetical protein GGI17_000447 [Coemansia sp. S146]|nr:hypothetical protein GGI17_000447 [Coemansia sp. S146]